MKKLFFIVLIILLFISPLQANSALKNWEGSDSYGVIATDEDCPLVIQHEDLFFNLQQLPKRLQPVILSPTRLTTMYKLPSTSQLAQRHSMPHI